MNLSPTSASKRPAEVLDYTFDFSSWLASGETVSTFSASADTGLTIDSSSNTTTTGTIFLSGGTQGDRYSVTVTITTSGARTSVGEVSFTIK